MKKKQQHENCTPFTYELERTLRSTRRFYTWNHSKYLYGAIFDVTIVSMAKRCLNSSFTMLEFFPQSVFFSYSGSHRNTFQSFLYACIHISSVLLWFTFWLLQIVQCFVHIYKIGTKRKRAFHTLNVPFKIACDLLYIQDIERTHFLSYDIYKHRSFSGFSLASWPMLILHTYTNKMSVISMSNIAFGYSSNK